MSYMSMINSLFKHGLGEYPVLYQRIDKYYLGNMVFEKGHIFFKDRSILKDKDVISDSHPWFNYLLGMVCYRDTFKWQSLSFFGLEHCQVGEGEFVYRNTLPEIVNKDKERMSDFIGSVYRAYKILLEHNFLPIVMLKQIQTHNNEHGICVCDLMSVNLSPETQEIVANIINQAVDKQITVRLEDMTIPGNR